MVSDTSHCPGMTPAQSGDSTTRGAFVGFAAGCFYSFSVLGLNHFAELFEGNFSDCGGPSSLFSGCSFRWAGVLWFVVPLVSCSGCLCLGSLIQNILALTNVLKYSLCASLADSWFLVLSTLPFELVL